MPTSFLETWAAPATAKDAGEVPFLANVAGRGFVLDSDSGDKGIDDVNGYRGQSVIGGR